MLGVFQAKSRDLHMTPVCLEVSCFFVIVFLFLLFINSAFTEQCTFRIDSHSVALTKILILAYVSVATQYVTALPPSPQVPYLVSFHLL